MQRGTRTGWNNESFPKKETNGANGETYREISLLRSLSKIFEGDDTYQTGRCNERTEVTSQ